jgi:mannose-6-phosphate isomerase-like protein (cupin superfamily)
MTVVVSAESPESFESGGCRFTVLDDGGATTGRIGVVQCDLVPGWGGPPQHIHREHDETFFVLTGTVRFTSGTDVLLARPAQLVTAPIGSPHTFANAQSDTPASLLCTVTPEKYIGYFRELAHLAPGADGRLDPQQVLAIMSRYATDPYRPPQS